jgi:hypothetical protein
MNKQGRKEEWTEGRKETIEGLEDNRKELLYDSRMGKTKALAT